MKWGGDQQRRGPSTLPPYTHMRRKQQPSLRSTRLVRAAQQQVKVSTVSSRQSRAAQQQCRSARSESVESRAAAVQVGTAGQHGSIVKHVPDESARARAAQQQIESAQSVKLRAVGNTRVRPVQQQTEPAQSDRHESAESSRAEQQLSEADRTAGQACTTAHDGAVKSRAAAGRIDAAGQHETDGQQQTELTQTDKESVESARARASHTAADRVCTDRQSRDSREHESRAAVGARCTHEYGSEFSRPAIDRVGTVTRYGPIKRELLSIGTASNRPRLHSRQSRVRPKVRESGS